MMSVWVLVTLFVVSVYSRTFVCNETRCDFGTCNTASCANNKYVCHSGTTECFLQCNAQCSNIVVESSADVTNVRCNNEASCRSVSIHIVDVASALSLECAKTGSCVDVNVHVTQASQSQCTDWSNGDCAGVIYHVVSPVLSDPPITSPTVKPTNPPSLIPTRSPTLIPSYAPTTPTFTPTGRPIATTTTTTPPTNNPSMAPTAYPTKSPTLNPSIEPTFNPTVVPSATPTVVPTPPPTTSTSMMPSGQPTKAPTKGPTPMPTSTATQQTQLTDLTQTSLLFIAETTSTSAYSSTQNELVQATQTTNEDADDDDEQLQGDQAVFAVHQKQGNSKTTAAVIVGTILFWLCLCGGMIVYIRARRRKRALEPNDEDMAHHIALQRVPSPEYEHDSVITSPNPMFQYRRSSEGIDRRSGGHTRLRNTGDGDDDDETAVLDDCLTYEDEPGLLQRFQDTETKNGKTTAELSVTEDVDEKGELSSAMTSMYDNGYETAGQQTKGNELVVPSVLRFYDEPSPITTQAVLAAELPLPMSVRSDKQSLIGSYDESLDLLYGPGKKTRG